MNTRLAYMIFLLHLIGCSVRGVGEGRFLGGERALYGIVGYEEEGCAGGGADEGGADAAVDAGEATGGVEAVGGLEAGF